MRQKRREFLAAVTAGAAGAPAPTIMRGRMNSDGMEYSRLGPTGIRVSRICLGTAFRSEPDEPVCIAAIHQAAELGCNFLDCANVYRDGLSEEIVGKAIRGRRDRFVVTTKVGAPTWEGVNSGGLSRKTILRDAEASLRRLGTDYIDLYLCHFPDPASPLEETVRAMDDLVRSGKVLYPGCSNFPAWQLSEALAISDRGGLAPYVCNQVLYNLLDRRIEDELVPFCAHRPFAITVFASTAIGLLSGRFRYGQAPPPRTSWARGPYNYRAAMTRRTDRIVQALIEVGDNHGKTPTEVAMAWCLSRPQITSVIIGADTPERVAEDFGASGWRLAGDELERLNTLSAGMRMVVRKDAPEGYREGEPWPDGYEEP